MSQELQPNKEWVSKMGWNILRLNERKYAHWKTTFPGLLTLEEYTKLLDEEKNPRESSQESA